MENMSSYAVISEFITYKILLWNGNFPLKYCSELKRPIHESNNEYVICLISAHFWNFVRRFRTRSFNHEHEGNVSLQFLGGTANT